jgi:hypothetical protein
LATTAERLKAEQAVSGKPEVSIVIPCLNEAQTLGQCIQKAQRSLVELEVDG